MAALPTPDGIAIPSRVIDFGERKIYNKVIDNVLTASMYWSRLQGMGIPFTGKSYDIPVKVTDSALGEFFIGMETLATSASDTVVTLSYTHNAADQPIVIPLLEAMANTGPEAKVDMISFKLEEAVAELVRKLGSAAFSTGSGNQFLGLEYGIDDGTNSSTLGGQSRTTYTNLKSTVTASGGTLTLGKLGTLFDNISAAGYYTEVPNISVTTKTIWSLYEQLIQPQVRTDSGYAAMPIAGNKVYMTEGELKGAAGFTCLFHRGRPVIADDFATSGVWYYINENYIKWAGRTVLPDSYKGQLTSLNIPVGKVTEGVMAQASKYNGWYYQPLQILPNQAGQVGRLFCIGQIVYKQGRRQGKLTGITTV